MNERELAEFLKEHLVIKLNSFVEVDGTYLEMDIFLGEELIDTAYTRIIKNDKR